MVKVKICGITNIEDAMAAVEAGADALGFVFAESPRQVTPKVVREIVQELPPFVDTVGVFANQNLLAVLSAMKNTGLHIAQLHGRADDELIRAFESLPWLKLIRAVRVRSDRDIWDSAEDASVAASGAVLLDAHVEGMMGGTGQTFDWDLALQARSLGKPIILAGGLTPENVEEAIGKVRPYAVDVSSGVEISPGKKDYEKIKEFIINAKKPV